MKDRLWKREREPMDEAVDCGHRDEGLAMGRDGGAMDEAVKCGHRNEGQAMGRDGGAMDETVKCGYRDEGQATGRDGGATDQNPKRCSGETECPSAPHLGRAEVQIHEPLPQGKTRCLPSSHVPQGADLGGVASGLSGCMIQAGLLKTSFERASDRDTA